MRIISINTRVVQKKKYMNTDGSHIAKCARDVEVHTQVTTTSKLQ